MATTLSVITAAVVGVILNLALWFALHVLFSDLRPVETMGLDFDMPVPGSLNPAAAMLVALAVVAAFA